MLDTSSTLRPLSTSLFLLVWSFWNIAFSAPSLLRCKTKVSRPCWTHRITCLPQLDNIVWRDASWDIWNSPLWFMLCFVTNPALSNQENFVLCFGKVVLCFANIVLCLDIFELCFINTVFCFDKPVVFQEYIALILAKLWLTIKHEWNFNELRTTTIFLFKTASLRVTEMSR